MFQIVNEARGGVNLSFIESKNQYYAPYWEWEDYLNGMYRVTNEGYLDQAKIMFTNNDICYNVMKNVTREWQVATKVNLTNLHCNRRAWLGQASACMYAKLTQQETCEVWKELTDEERDVANKIADKVIKEWEKENGR